MPIGYRIIANYCEQNGLSQWQFLKIFKHNKIYFCWILENGFIYVKWKCEFFSYMKNHNKRFNDQS